MRKITFLLTLLLMYVGVTPMMAVFSKLTIDVNKKYAIKLIYNGMDSYLYMNGSDVLVGEQTPQNESYYFKFEETGENVKYKDYPAYYIRSAENPNNYLVCPNFSTSTNSVFNLNVSASSKSKWSILNEQLTGGTLHQCIMYLNVNGTTVTSKYWYYEASTKKMGIYGTRTSSAPQEGYLLIEEVEDSGEGEGGGSEGQPDEEETIDYSVNFQNDTHDGTRKIQQISVGSFNAFEIENTYNNIYFDKTDRTLTVFAGSDIQVQFTYSGQWMNRYIYIDEDNDGFKENEAGVANDGYTPIGDLKSFSFYDANGDGSGFNSLGSAISGDDRKSQTQQAPKFKAPENPGTYRMRFKVDWNDLNPKGSIKEDNTIKKNCGAIVDITLNVLPKVPVTLSLAEITADDNLLYGLEGYIGTFSAPYATAIPNGVTAYYASPAEINGTNTITLTPLKATGTSVLGVPSNFGVILVSTTQNITMSPIEDRVDNPENAFGNTADGSVVMGNNCYVLAQGDQGIGLYQATEGTTLAANKAYLQLNGTAGTSALRLVLDETVTGINGVATEKADAPIYDLSGRRVLNTVKGGIYIQNGKKFIVK